MLNLSQFQSSLLQMAMAKHSFSDDEEETLSLCDLPIYSNPADWEHIKKVDSNLSPSSDEDQEFFEFSSKDFSASNHEAESIIFCGKLIPHREQQAAKLEIIRNPKQNSKKISIFGRKSRTSPSPKGHNKVQHMAIAKSRWYMYMFGLRRFPMEMELGDIKNRQSRHIPTPMFQSQENRGDMVRSRGKGLWALLRVWGCRSSHHATTMVKSVTCI